MDKPTEAPTPTGAAHFTHLMTQATAHLERTEDGRHLCIWFSAYAAAHNLPFPDIARRSFGARFGDSQGGPIARRR